MTRTRKTSRFIAMEYAHARPLVSVSDLVARPDNLGSTLIFPVMLCVFAMALLLLMYEVVK